MASVVKGLYSLRPGDEGVGGLSGGGGLQLQRLSEPPTFVFLFLSFRVGPAGSGTLLQLHPTNPPSRRGIPAARLRESRPEATNGALHERFSTVSFFSRPLIVRCSDSP